MPILIPRIHKLVQVEKEKIIREQVTNWLMGFASGRLETRRFNGQKIAYAGIKFSGSPQDVFWGGYIEPYLEEITERLIREIIKECLNNGLNVVIELPPLADNLKNLYVGVYNKMAETEQKLLGEGYPDRIPKRNVASNIADMNHYLTQHIAMEIHKYERKTKSQKSSGFIKKFWNNSIQDNVISSIIYALFAGLALLLWNVFEHDLREIWLELLKKIQG